MFKKIQIANRARHCEEHSDAAIQNAERITGFPRYACNNELK